MISDEDVTEYLFSKYEAEMMNGGHRQQLHAAACDIADRFFLEDNFSERDGMIMRRAWECSRAGAQNVACQALADSNLFFKCPYPNEEFVAEMINMPGFLNKKEIWHTSRLNGKLRRDVKIYRGCSDDEAKEYKPVNYCGIGYSWTLDWNIANWFAHIHQGKVITAKIAAWSVWLNTPESEIIAPNVSLVNIEKPKGKEETPDWKKQQRITPAQAAQLAA